MSECEDARRVVTAAVSQAPLQPVVGADMSRTVHDKIL